jgi:hypothetical protein
MHLQTKSTPQNAKYRAKVLLFFELTKFICIFFTKYKADFTILHHAKTTTGDMGGGNLLIVNQLQAHTKAQYNCRKKIRFFLLLSTKKTREHTYNDEARIFSDEL